MRKENREVYISEDGQLFFDEKECLKYEKNKHELQNISDIIKFLIDIGFQKEIINNKEIYYKFGKNIKQITCTYFIIYDNNHIMYEKKFGNDLMVYNIEDWLRRKSDSPENNILTLRDINKDDFIIFCENILKIK